MEEELDLGGDILLRYLEKSGVSLPKGVSSIQTLKQTPGALFSICARSLQKIDESLLPEYILTEEEEEEEEGDSVVSMAQKFNLCTQMSASFEKLAYPGGQISFHQFLYPSQDDLYSLLRFLVERMSLSDTLSKSKDTESSSFAKDKENETTTTKSRGQAEECVLRKHPLSDCADHTNKNADTSSATSRIIKLLTIDKSHQAPELHGTTNTEVYPGSPDDSENNMCSNGLPFETDLDRHASARSDSLEFRDEDELQNVKIAAGEEESENSSTHASENEPSSSLKEESHEDALVERLSSLRASTSKMRNEIKNLRIQGEMLKQELESKTLECQQLESKHELLERAVGMTINDQHPADLHIEELNKKIETPIQNLQELGSHRNASIKLLEDKKGNPKEVLFAQKLKTQSDLPKVKEDELEIEAIKLEIQNREEERFNLSVELEKRPKAATRKSYILRISEITKNSRKQDADIERILKDTRDLQIESNLMQERLHRTHMVADETMIRDSKKDPVRQQAYRLLTTIHESFTQISEKILATDRVRREMVEQEAKLAAVATHNVNMDKLQADLDTVRKENELLEKRLLHQSIAQEETR